MSKAMFCRSCLAIAADSRLHNLSDGLMEVFRSLTGLPLKSENTSQLFCTDCKHVLGKIRIFQKQCLTVETLMNDLVTAGVEINEKSLTLINKDTKCSNTRISRVHTINCCSTCDTNNYEQNQAYNIIYPESIPKDKKHDILSQRYINVYDEKLCVLEELKVKQNNTDDNFNDETVKEEMDSTTNDEVGDLHVFGNKSRNFSNETFEEAEKTMQLQTFKPKKQFQCDLCSYTFTQRCNLVTHLKKSVCVNTFTDITSLNQHTIFHTKSFVCNYCNKVLTSKKDLIKHIKEHTRIMCAYCDKPFASTSELKRHIRTHQKRLYECKFCERTYMTNNHLHTHIIRVHTKDCAYFICEFCSKSFTAKSIYESHLRSHTGSKPYKCDVCGKSFSQKFNMKIHFMIHTGEKPHKCKICNATFRTNFVLKKHLNVHLGERPLSCHLCYTSFARMTSLKAHLKSHWK